MKITIYELLGKVKDDTKTDIYINYYNRISQKEDTMWACKENIIYKLDQKIIELNDEVEIIEEVEDKEYEDIEEINILTDDTNMNYVANDEYGKLSYSKVNLLLANRINALIRNQKYILERIKKNEVI